MLLPTLLLAIAPQVEAPDHDSLVAQGRALMPSYEGDHKSFLSGDERANVEAAGHLFSAALALEPESAYAHWWRGRSEVLLGEDERNRGEVDLGQRHYAAALAAYDRGLELAPDYYWGHYARGMANLSLGRFDAAVRDYDRAVELANARIEADGRDAAGDAPFVRYKAREWRADARMHLGQFDEARAEFTAFYADNGNNPWDLGFALGETLLRERDFDGARDLYLDLLEQRDYANYEGIHAQLGYLAGLVDGREADAARHLNDAMAYEFTPTLYPKLWRWVLTEGDVRAEAEAELREFLEHPPSSLSAWDRTLGAFVLAPGGHVEFARAADAELARRAAAGELLDDLPCEVAFYQGLRLALDARTTDDEAERRALLERAVERHRAALAFRPRTFKWEWAYARRHLARLADELGLVPEALDLEPSGELLGLSLHRPGAGAPEDATDLPGALPVGTLVRVDRRAADGGRTSRLHVAQPVD